MGARLLFLLLGAMMLLAPAARAADSYVVSSTATEAINEWGVCRRVTNNTAGGLGLFVPTKFQGEWANSPTSFLSSTLPGVSLSDCLNAVSLRFKPGSATYLSRTPGVAGNQRTWTWSAWVKRGNISLAADSHLLSARSAGNPLFLLRFASNDTLNVFARNSGGSTIASFSTTQVLRDPSAWYHIVLTLDATNGTIALSVNGTTTSTSVSNVDFAVNGTVVHEIGRHAWSAAEYFDGYMAEVHFVDGQALPATAFAETNPVTGQWVPKTYGGSYGTNGYRLSFDNTASLGTDSSGQGNNWTPNNFSTTAGVTYDPMSDYATPVSNEGANGIGNHATFNPLPIWGGDRAVLSNGNLTAVTGANVQGGPSTGTMAIPGVGKWYFEVKVDSGLYPVIGIQKQNATAWADGIYWSGYHAKVYKDSDGGTNIAGLAANDVVGIAVDSDGGQVSFYKNGVLALTTAYGRFGEGDYMPYVSSANSGGSLQFSANFGQREFVHGPPAGFKALNTYNLPAPAIITPTAYFKPITYTGNGGYLSVGNPAALTGGANVSASLRFEAAGSSALSRLYGTTGNTNKFTLSFWIKKNSLTTQDALIGCTNDASNFTYIRFAGGTEFNTRFRIGGTDYQSSWPVAFQDPAAWHHIVYVYDRQNPTARDRQILYLDGARITPSSSSNPSSNLTSWGTARTHYIGYAAQNAIYLDAYLADFHYVDGEAMAATDFGQFNSAGAWVPKAYGGAYGTNGFHLTFNDKSNTTAGTLGADSSGNGNNWTPTNFSVTAGLDDDVGRDVPSAYTDSNGSHGNFATLNPLDKVGTVTLLAGNLQYAVASGGQIRGTIGTAPDSGKWYWEYIATSPAAPSTPQGFGISTLDGPITNNSTALKKAVYAYINGAASNFFEYYQNGLAQLGTPTLCINSVAIFDVLQVAYDAATGNLWFGKNNTWCNSSGGTTGSPATGANPTATIATGDRMAPFLENIGAAYSGVLNAGQKPFTYSPPAGFAGLSTANMPSSEFVPDLVLIKSRSAATDWAWYDTARGPTLDLASNATTLETAQSTGLLSFQSGGFTLGALAKLNTNAATYIAYLFKKGVTPGFDVVTYTGTGAARTVAHGLGTTPAMLIAKGRDGTADHWRVWHKNLTSAAYSLALNQTTAQTDMTGAQPFNDTAPNASVFSVGTDVSINQSGKEFVAYLFAEKEGFSKFGSYTGNGSADGSFIFTGFRPAFVLVKRVDSTENWLLKDGMRLGYNPRNDTLYPNLTNAETNDAQLDLLSNGFKLRNTTLGNASGGTYVFAAFAEAPFKHANAR
jgi:hypothetical protein